MGKVKEWAMSEQECVVCSHVFIPMFVGCEVDIAVPTCSPECYVVAHEVNEGDHCPYCTKSLRPTG